jgi:hypothetical protein
MPVAFVSRLTKTNTKSVIDLPVETPLTDNESPTRILGPSSSNPYSSATVTSSLIDGIYVSAPTVQSTEREHDVMLPRQIVNLPSETITPYLKSIIDEVGGLEQFSKEDLAALVKFIETTKSDFTFDIQDLYRHDEY